MNTQEREKDICIHMCNEGKKSMCTFDPCQGTEEKKRGRR